MLFEVAPKQVEDLDSKQLVELLRRLLYLEASATGVPLGNVSVPVQITVADGGEDAHITWQGGLHRTGFLPARNCIFQSKATDPGPSGWKKEAWTKTSQAKGKRRVLNRALSNALRERAAYLGFTSAALVGSQIEDRIKHLREGIEEAGGDADQLRAISILDANKIAAWAQTYPSVATWLHESASRMTLAGFSTFSRWGKANPDFERNPRVEEGSARFRVGAIRQVGIGDEKNTITAQQAQERILVQLLDERSCIRVVGPSGIGKTRFVFEMLNSAGYAPGSFQPDSVIYCDFRSVSSSLSQVLDSVANCGSMVTFVVDECPKEDALRFGELVRRSSSKVRLITIDTDEGALPRDGWTQLSIEPGGKGWIENIVRQRLTSAIDSEIAFIAMLSGGFPRIAVLACDSYEGGRPILESIEDAVDRILHGAGIRNETRLRSLECLSLFEQLHADDAEQFDLAAERLARISGDELYEELVNVAQNHLVDRRGRAFVAQPLPIAVHLGRRRVERLRASTVLAYLRECGPFHRHAFLDQMRHLSGTQSTAALAAVLLSPQGLLQSFTELNTDDGAHALDALVHVEPNAAMEALSRLLGRLDIDQMKGLDKGRRHVVWALERLIFRRESFVEGSRLLLKLAAAENETIGNNATSIFKQLFQLHLSGTEVEPKTRFVILDEGIDDGDERLASVCLDALSESLSHSHFSRSGEANVIGNRPPLKDWEPKTWGDVYAFHQAGLERIQALRKRYPSLREKAEGIIASSLRELLQLGPMLEDVSRVAEEIASERNMWLDGIKGVGDWLYFDRKGAPQEYSERIRALYDRLMPTSDIDKALLYTKYWSADIHDPDVDYDKDSSGSFDYSTNQSVAIARRIASDVVAAKEVLEKMVPLTLHNVFPFARALSLAAENATELLEFAVDVLDRGCGVGSGNQFIRGLLSGIEEAHPDQVESAIKAAQRSLYLSGVDIYAAVKITPQRLEQIASKVKAGDINASEAVLLSYGRGLDHLSATELLPLLRELAQSREADSAWAALEVVSMYQHGRAGIQVELADFIKKMLVSPALLGKVRSGQRDSYLFEALFKLLQVNGLVDDHFARQIAEQIVRACQIEDRAAFFALDDAFRKVLVEMTHSFPKQVWAAVSEFYAVASPFERHWLQTIVEPSRRGFEGDGHDGAGTLYGIPEPDLFSWVDADAASRAAFLCVFYPVLVFESNEWRWHSSMASLMARYGKHPSFRLALARRLGPTSWVGSRIPYLEKYLHPLEEWFDHEIPAVQVWARETFLRLTDEISRERERDLDR